MKNTQKDPSPAKTLRKALVDLKFQRIRPLEDVIKEAKKELAQDS